MRRLSWASRSISGVCFIAVFLLSGVVMGQSYYLDESSKVILPEDLREDLDTLRSWVLEAHPHPFVHCTPEEFRSAFTTANQMARIPCKSITAARLLQSALRVMRDSHTSVLFAPLRNELGLAHGVLPFEVTTIQGKSYVRMDRSGVLAPGTEVQSIHGRPPRADQHMALSLAPIEGKSQTAVVRFADAIWNDISPASFQSAPGELIEVLIPDSLGGMREVEVWSLAEIEKWDRLFSEEVLVWEHAQEPGEATVLAISSFSAMTERAFKRSLMKGMKTFVAAYNTGESIGLVLDLRGNKGGAIHRVALVLSLLAGTDAPVEFPASMEARRSRLNKDVIADQLSQRISRSVRKGPYAAQIATLRNELATCPMDSSVYWEPAPILVAPGGFAGPLALLVDGGTASAATLLAGWFSATKRGTLYGERMQGGADGSFANPGVLSLPKTGIDVMISTAQIRSTPGLAWGERPLEPDVSIGLTPADLATGKDIVLESAVLGLKTKEDEP